MSKDLPIHNDEQLLAAFADGELTGEQYGRALQRLSSDPALARRVADQQKLREAVAKVMGESTPGAPDALRARIADFAKQPPFDAEGSDTPSRPEQERPAVLAVIGRWLPAAVAALFFVGALIALNKAGDFSPTPRLIDAGNILSAAAVEQFGARHYTCSRHMAPLHGRDKFPQDLAQLPGALSDYFQKPINPEVLDLSELGMTFDMAGLCVLPGEGAVHLVYESRNGERLSLWMRPADPDSGIQPDRLYAAPDKQAPMLVFRHGDMVYYLVGDSSDMVEQAFEAIRKDVQAPSPSLSGWTR